MTELSSLASVDDLLPKLVSNVVRGKFDIRIAIEIIERQIDHRAITLDQSQALAKYVTKNTNSEGWRAALVMGQLCWELAKTLDNVAKDRAVNYPLKLAYLRAVTVALGQTPAFSLYVQARHVAATLLWEARKSGLENIASWTNTELGQLHTSPLQSQQTHADPAQDAGIHRWYELGTQSLALGKTYPYPRHAFKLAAQQFRRSQRSLDGRELAAAIKSEISALQSLFQLSDQPNTQELASRARQAQELLDPIQDAVDITYLMSIQQSNGEELNHRLLQTMMLIPLEHFTNSIGAQATVMAHLNMSGLLREINRSDALSIVNKAEPAYLQLKDDTIRVRYLKRRLSALAESWGADIPVLELPVTEAIKAGLVNADADEWPAGRILNHILRVIVASSEQNLEQDGLSCLEHFKQHLQPFYGHHKEAMDFLKMVLCTGAGVNEVKQDNYDQGLINYASGVKIAVRLNFNDFALTHLEYSASLVPKLSETTVLPLVGILFDMGLDLEISLGEKGASCLNLICDRLTELILVTHQSINGNVVHMLWQLAKSRRFGAAIRSGAVDRLGKEVFEHPVLDDIATLRQQVTLFEEASSPGAQLDRSSRLLTFVRSQAPHPGKTPPEHLMNLQFFYDRLLEQHLTVLSNVPEADIYALNQIEENLDERTVLLQMFLFELQGTRAIATLITSQQDSFLNVTPDNVDALSKYERKDNEVKGYSYLEDVKLTRRACLDDSTLTPEEQRQFFHAAGGAFLHGGVFDELCKLREKGADHLLIVPHGPFHQAPLHLFAKNEWLLCDDWIVTVIPNIELIRRRAGNVASKPEGATVLGNNFKESNPFGVSQLKNAEDEAKRIAKKLGVIPILGAEATESSVCSGMINSRYIHLASHGAFNLDAPAFQYILLTPDDQSDGILHSYDLLRLDLKGVAVATLSACETALTKTDQLDNPRGIAASLLLAGVETVVATLWNVRGDTSRAFFVHFYAELVGGLSRRDAFRSAQNEVRRRFPAYRDWGAFYMLGAWS